jgi:uncharacterized membrane protein YdjX (TVP38/TMEM64 family)
LTPPTKEERTKKGRGGVVKIAVIIAVIIFLFLLTRYIPIADYIMAMLKWTQGLGIWGPVVVALFYIFSCVFFIPGSIVTMGAGFLFGTLVGTITVSIGSTLGAAVAFLVGRFLMRDTIERKVEGNPKFAAIDRAVGEQGFKIVLLSRLSPVLPFVLLNYAYGLTKVTFWRYVLASWIGMFPGTVMYVYFGSTAGKLAKIAAGEVEGDSARTIFFIIGLIVTVFVVVLVTRTAQKALRDAVPGSAQPPA